MRSFVHHDAGALNAKTFPVVGRSPALAGAASAAPVTQERGRDVKNTCEAAMGVECGSHRDNTRINLLSPGGRLTRQGGARMYLRRKCLRFLVLP